MKSYSALQNQIRIFSLSLPVPYRSVSLSLSPHIKFVGSMGQFGASQQEKSAIPPYPQPKPVPGQGLSHQTEGLDVLLGIAWPILAQRKAAVLGMVRSGPAIGISPFFDCLLQCALRQMLSVTQLRTAMAHCRGGVQLSTRPFPS
ncbi:hypothetical protein CPAR01_08747 [Colletotrichum paranaense]|uniref:Uncharacterized protein n=1 Tax=Colletotrichum paranaense TaxID=1914294 RepID=A0ABQ9SLC8_9PEZI|nr:uncharacterized protein CPAR01_08747 [Colletotrichum paranaense]KAK1538634.1 hypothetical protein CPAR01_08747 [Colletotrichum paranaense]